MSMLRIHPFNLLPQTAKIAAASGAKRGNARAFRR
jgi:hypothetical protein